MGENYPIIDNKIFLYSKKENRNFDTVFAYITSNYSNAEERARAFYMWISLNINYDTDKIDELETQRIWNFKTHFRPTSQLADTVIKNGKAVCEGFSNLFMKFCRAASIPCEMVVGYSKMENGQVITGILHAWNVIQIDNEWYPVDITWSNGYVDGSRKYVKRFSTKYFMLPPDIFHKDHLPLDPMWQLSNQPITIKKFCDDTLKISTPYYSTQFNYKDSISQYCKLPAGEEKDHARFLHYYAFDTTQTLYAQNADFSVLNAASDHVFNGNLEYDEYVQLIKKSMAPGRSFPDPKKMKMLLQNAGASYRKAYDLLKGTKALYAGDAIDWKNNLDIVNENLKMIAEETKRVNLYAKMQPKKPVTKKK